MSTAILCKQCRYWDTDERTCGRDERVDQSRQFWVDARATDDSGLIAELRTGPDFGCVLGERDWLRPDNRAELSARLSSPVAAGVLAPETADTFLAFAAERDSVLAGNAARTVAFYHHLSRADACISRLIAAGVLPR